LDITSVLMTILSPAGPPIRVDRGVFQDQLPRMRSVHSAAQFDSCRFIAAWWHPVISSRAPHRCSPPDRFPKSCFQCRPLTSCTVLPQAGSAVRGLSTNDIRRRRFPGCGACWWIYSTTFSVAAPVPPHVVVEQDRSACKVPQQGIATRHTHALHGTVHDDRACSGGGGIASSPPPEQKRALCTLQSCAFEALEQEIDGLTH
jgi:hypothetical protein